MFNRLKIYTELPVVIFKEDYESFLEQNQNNKGRLIVRFINDKGENITDMWCKVKGFNNEIY